MSESTNHDGDRSPFYAFELQRLGGLNQRILRGLLSHAQQNVILELGGGAVSRFSAEDLRVRNATVVNFDCVEHPYGDVPVRMDLQQLELGLDDPKLPESIRQQELAAVIASHVAIFLRPRIFEVFMESSFQHLAKNGKLYYFEKHPWQYGDCSSDIREHYWASRRIMKELEQRHANCMKVMHFQVGPVLSQKTCLSLMRSLMGDDESATGAYINHESIMPLVYAGIAQVIERPVGGGEFQAMPDGKIFHQHMAEQVTVLTRVDPDEQAQKEKVSRQREREIERRKRAEEKRRKAQKKRNRR